MIESTPETKAQKFISDRIAELNEAWRALADGQYQLAREAVNKAASNLPLVAPMINVEEGLPDFSKPSILGPEDS
jgi:hypothetical protein